MKPLNSYYGTADYGSYDQNFGMANYATRRPNKTNPQDQKTAFMNSPWGKSYLEKNKKLSSFFNMF